MESNGTVAGEGSICGSMGEAEFMESTAGNAGACLTLSFLHFFNPGTLAHLDGPTHIQDGFSLSIKVLETSHICLLGDPESAQTDSGDDLLIARHASYNSDKTLLLFGQF